MPRLSLELREDRATPECNGAVGINAKVSIKVSADIDIKGGLGNRFQHGIDIPIKGTTAEPGHARQNTHTRDQVQPKGSQSGDMLINATIRALWHLAGS